jgi:hypothetical protein
MAVSDLDGVVWHGHWWRFLTWALQEASRPTSEELGLAWPWRRVSTRLVAAWSMPVWAWSGLGGAGGVRPGCGGADLGRGVLSVVQIRCFNNNLVFEFFCFEMMCQYVIGGQKTLGFCHDLTEGALHIFFLFKAFNHGHCQTGCSHVPICQCCLLLGIEHAVLAFRC